MEIKKTPFSVLRERLYAAAAAGTSVMQEDFRLQRAVEGFQPMAEKAKPYEKLYKMCCELTTAQDPAEQLALCIALADALAVAQSVFQDDAEAEPVPAAPLKNLNTLSYLDAESWVKNIRAGQGFDKEKLNELRSVAGDIRLLSAFLEISGRDTENAVTNAMPFLEQYGTALIPLLKQAVDLKNPKSKGKQVYYISQLAGKAENDYYLSLAENEEVPAAVRIEAINAMGAAPQNAERLLVLYQTGKGKVKEAALMALCRTNSPLADKPLEKVFAGAMKDVNIEYAEICSRPAAYEYLRKHLDYALKVAVGERDKEHLVMGQVIRMLANKPDVDVEFLQCVAWYKEKGKLGEKPWMRNVDFQLNGILIWNVVNHPGDEAYESLICRLYDRDPELFFHARLWLALRKQPETALSAFEQECHRRARVLVYILERPERHADGAWYFRSASYVKAAHIRLFDKLPENLFAMLEGVVRSRDQADHSAICLLMQQFYAGLEGAEQKKAAAAGLRISDMLLLLHPSLDALRLRLCVARDQDNSAALTLMLVNGLRKDGTVPEVWSIIASLRKNMTSAQVQKATEDALREIAADPHISQSKTVDAINKINRVLNYAKEYGFES